MFVAGVLLQPVKCGFVLLQPGENLRRQVESSNYREWSEEPLPARRAGHRPAICSQSPHEDVITGCVLPPQGNNQRPLRFAGIKTGTTSCKRLVRLVRSMVWPHNRHKRTSTRRQVCRGHSRRHETLRPQCTAVDADTCRNPDNNPDCSTDNPAPPQPTHAQGKGKFS